MRPVLVLVCAVSCAASLTVGARAEPVALTFDDLPSLSLPLPTAYARTTTERLLRGLRRHHLPAIGFVNEGKLEGSDRPERVKLLRRWLEAGMDLGNHTYSHESLNKTPLDAYIADVLRGEAVTRRLLAERGRRPIWFRHPYLETGLTLEVRQAFENWLAMRGYSVAPVTMENSDWVFALAYDEAVGRRDKASARRIRMAYLDYTARVVPWYREAALALLGRRPAFVFLLHATRLNADCIGELAALLGRNDLQAVTLGQAMRDPAYSIPDTYVGPNGDEWLSRWSLTLRKELPWSSFPDPPADIVADDERLDSDP